MIWHSGSAPESSGIQFLPAHCSHIMRGSLHAHGPKRYYLRSAAKWRKEAKGAYQLSIFFMVISYFIGLMNISPFLRCKANIGLRMQNRKGGEAIQKFESTRKGHNSLGWNRGKSLFKAERSLVSNKNSLKVLLIQGSTYGKTVYCTKPHQAGIMGRIEGLGLWGQLLHSRDGWAGGRGSGPEPVGRKRLEEVQRQRLVHSLKALDFQSVSRMQMLSSHSVNYLLKKSPVEALYDTSNFHPTGQNKVIQPPLF